MDDHLSITSSTSYDRYPPGVFAETIDTILMSTKSINKGFGKHSIQLRGGQRSCVFSWFVEGMKVGGEITLNWMRSFGG